MQALIYQVYAVKDNVDDVTLETSIECIVKIVQDVWAKRDFVRSFLLFFFTFYLLPFFMPDHTIVYVLCYHCNHLYPLKGSVIPGEQHQTLTATNISNNRNNNEMTLMTSKIAYATKHDRETNVGSQQWSKVAKQDEIWKKNSTAATAAYNSKRRKWLWSMRENWHRKIEKPNYYEAARKRMYAHPKQSYWDKYIRYRKYLTKEETEKELERWWDCQLWQRQQLSLCKSRYKIWI